MHSNPFEIQDTVDAIMARNRARFGHGQFFMTAGTDEGGTGGDAGSGDGGDSGSGDSGQGSGGSGSGGDGSGDGAGAEDVSSLPAWAQKALKDARADAGKARTEAKKTAAEEAQQAVLTKVLEGLGIKGNKTPTLEEVQAELDKVKNEKGNSDGELNQTKVELAVYRIASKKDVGADPDALLDSRSFLEKLRDLDPSASDFSDKVTKAIKDAVKDNPKLKASQAGAGSSSADHGSGGSGEAGTRKPVTLDQAVGGHYGA